MERAQALKYQETTGSLQCEGERSFDSASEDRSASTCNSDSRLPPADNGWPCGIIYNTDGGKFAPSMMHRVWVMG
eukprot:1909473-Rhodomonas_salina.2